MSFGGLQRRTAELGQHLYIRLTTFAKTDFDGPRRKLVFTLADCRILASYCGLRQPQAFELGTDFAAAAIVFLFNAHNDLLEEIAKKNTERLRRVWARLMRQNDFPPPPPPGASRPEDR